MMDSSRDHELAYATSDTYVAWLELWCCMDHAKWQLTSSGNISDIHRSTTEFAMMTKCMLVVLSSLPNSLLVNLIVRQPRLVWDRLALAWSIVQSGKSEYTTRYVRTTQLHVIRVMESNWRNYAHGGLEDLALRCLLLLDFFCCVPLIWGVSKCRERRWPVNHDLF
jgi:hypothetical protein